MRRAELLGALILSSCARENPRYQAEDATGGSVGATSEGVASSSTVSSDDGSPLPPDASTTAVQTGSSDTGFGTSTTGADPLACTVSNFDVRALATGGEGPILGSDCFGTDFFRVDEAELDAGVLRGRFLFADCAMSKQGVDGELHLGAAMDTDASLSAIEPGCYAVSLSFTQDGPSAPCDLQGVAFRDASTFELLFATYDAIVPDFSNPLPVRVSADLADATPCEGPQPDSACSLENPDRQFDLRFRDIEGTEVAYLPFGSTTEATFLGSGDFRLWSHQGVGCSDLDDVPRIGWSAQRRLR